jgi:enolase
VKTAKGRVSKAQKSRAAALERVGAVHVVVRAPEDEEYLDEGVARAVREVDEAIARRRARRA